MAPDVLENGGIEWAIKLHADVFTPPPLHVRPDWPYGPNPDRDWHLWPEFAEAVVKAAAMLRQIKDGHVPCTHPCVYFANDRDVVTRLHSFFFLLIWRRLFHARRRLDR